jgi:hypothetical protein
LLANALANQPASKGAQARLPHDPGAEDEARPPAFPSWNGRSMFAHVKPDATAATTP